MDKLKLLKGDPYVITDKVTVLNPQLCKIVEYGEERYWSTILNLCATSFDHILTLEESGVDYLDVDDWEMFVAAKSSFKPEDTNILLPGIDLSKLIAYKSEDSGKIVLANKKGEIIIDEIIYNEIVTFIRDVHGIERNYKIPGNKLARSIYLREAMEAREFAGRKRFKSVLEPLVSAMCNANGFKYNFDTVWELPIYTFMNSVKRISKIQKANNISQGIYGGMLDVSKMNKAQLNKDLDWMGEL